MNKIGEKFAVVTVNSSAVAQVLAAASNTNGIVLRTAHAEVYASGHPSFPSGKIVVWATGPSGEIVEICGGIAVGISFIGALVIPAGWSINAISDSNGRQAHISYDELP